MSNRSKQAEATHTSRPRSFNTADTQIAADTRTDPRRLEKLGRAVDEVVASFVLLSEAGAEDAPINARRLAAAGRRLWDAARSMNFSLDRPS